MLRQADFHYELTDLWGGGNLEISPYFPEIFYESVGSVDLSASLFLY